MVNRSILQTPGGTNLLHELRATFTDTQVVRSYALIAFATLSGVQLLGVGPNEPLSDFLSRGGTMDWLIGVDSVTTADALQVLHEIQKTFPNTVRISVYSSNRGLFHPKYYLFQRSDSSGVLFVGSNNLTAGGLVSNTEYSLREEIAGADFNSRQDVFATLSGHHASVAPLTSSVIAALQASQLSATGASRGVPAAQAKLMAAATDGESDERVFLRSVPQSGARLSQVGIPSRYMSGFFGLSVPGDSVRLQQAFTTGMFAPVEHRPLVRSGTNLNRRLEIDALKGVSYPSSGRPILVFQEVVAHDFYRYLLLMPGDPGHANVDALLSNITPRANETPSYVTTVGQLLSSWPGYPL